MPLYATKRVIYLTLCGFRVESTNPLASPRFTSSCLEFLYIIAPICDRSLFFGKRVHSAANTETGEKREKEEVLGVLCLPSYPSVSPNHIA